MRFQYSGRIFVVGFTADLVGLAVGLPAGGGGGGGPLPPEAGGGGGGGAADTGGGPEPEPGGGGGGSEEPGGKGDEGEGVGAGGPVGPGSGKGGTCVVSIELEAVSNDELHSVPARGEREEQTFRNSSNSTSRVD